MKFVDKIKSLVGKKTHDASQDRTVDRGTVYTPIDAAPESKLTSSTSLDRKKFDDLLTEFKENPSAQSLKPLENYLGDSLNKSKVQNTIRSLPDEKCSHEAKQALQKQVGEAIVKMATQQSR